MQSFLWTSSEAESATNCKSSAPWHAQGVSIDSRSLKVGDIYIALRGANHDGHDFIKEAIAKGASCLLIDTLPKDDISVPFLLVEDTLQALRQLGIYARNRTKAKIIGITGSVGKTSTKEALYIAFSSVARAIANQGGLNNHWGLPLSLARIPEDIDYAILEMGMNHVGEIHDLSLMAKPHL
ncbi:MAG: Mur ligase family protein, partial [Alphaproteobacteria bacterium]|nr:Mur ligase family protein [Alphaproteobacteria bacterium]